MDSPSPILFSAFEHSADHLAAPLIAELRRREPDRPIYALGGQRMAEAGAELLEETTHVGVMFGEVASRALAHRSRLGRVSKWLRSHDVAAVVPTDSPAANWSICRITRRRRPRARIVHLVAPQLWAWAPWRIGRLRRLTDHVMCMLPFEPSWLGRRGVAASFVGHPLFEAHEPPALDLPNGGEPRLALLPGSREAEVRRNWPTMVEAAADLGSAFPGMRCVAAAVDAEHAASIRVTAGSITVVEGAADAVLTWADAALVASGTATLQAAQRRVPMVVVYNVGRLGWHLAGRWLIQTRTFSLPNLIGEAAGIGRVVPELVPHFGRVEPVTRALEPLLTDGPARRKQQTGFDLIAETFADRHFATTAADRLLAEINRS